MKNLFLGLFSVLSFNLIAQYQLNGIVFDESSNEPLVGATVIIDESFNGGFTDADGNFRLNKILTQKIILMTSYIGYNTDSLEINVKENEDVVIYLKPLSYQTDEVLVSGTRVQANTPATVTTLNKKDITISMLDF